MTDELQRLEDEVATEVELEEGPAEELGPDAGADDGAVRVPGAPEEREPADELEEGPAESGWPGDQPDDEPA